MRSVQKSSMAASPDEITKSRVTNLYRFCYNTPLPDSFSMKPEQQRHERALRYAETLRERLRSGILAELQPLRQWVVWKQNRTHKARARKFLTIPVPLSLMPVSPVLRHGGTLDQALQALATGRYSGIGFMVTPPLVFIDLDHCFDKP